MTWAFDIRLEGGRHGFICGVDFWRSVRASVAMEFAIVLPILIILLIGLVEIRSGFVAKQRTIVAATTMSSIVAEAEQIDRRLISNMKEIARTIISPQRIDTLRIDVAVVTYTGLKLVVDWQGGSSDDIIDLSQINQLVGGLLLTNETAIITTVRLQHEPTLAGGVISEFELFSGSVVYPDQPVKTAQSDGQGQTIRAQS